METFAGGYQPYEQQHGSAVSGTGHRVREEGRVHGIVYPNDILRWSARLFRQSDELIARHHDRADRSQVPAFQRLAQEEAQARAEGSLALRYGLLLVPKNAMHGLNAAAPIQ